jgi:ankyrin repeat protein
MDAKEEPVFDPYVSALLDMVLHERWEEINMHLSSPQKPLSLKSLGVLLCAACILPEIPLESFQTILKVGGSEAASFTDNNERTPLHIAILEAADSRPELIQLLVDTAPEAARQRDVEGLLPIEILTQKILMKEERLRYITHHPVSSRTGRDLQANWQCAYILVKATQGKRRQGQEYALTPSSNSHLNQVTGLHSSHDVDGEENDKDDEGANNHAAMTPARQLMLHACLKANDIPLALIERAMKRYHDQLEEIDDLGDLPLHLVAAQGQADDTEDDLLGEILNAYPPAACVRNNRGALPLDLAIASGRRWKTGIEKLLQVNPEALMESTVSVISDSLYPLIVATLLQHDATSLVFGMLTAKPGLIRLVPLD